MEPGGKSLTCRAIPQVPRHPSVLGFLVYRVFLRFEIEFPIAYTSSELAR